MIANYQCVHRYRYRANQLRRVDLPASSMIVKSNVSPECCKFSMVLSNVVVQTTDAVRIAKLSTHVANLPTSRILSSGIEISLRILLTIVSGKTSELISLSTSDSL